jgi:hypothetical protein
MQSLVAPFPVKARPEAILEQSKRSKMVKSLPAVENGSECFESLGMNGKS